MTYVEEGPCIYDAQCSGKLFCAIDVFMTASDLLATLPIQMSADDESVGLEKKFMY
jgi:hypothetical protein